VSQPVAADYVLPPALVTRADLARLVREVEALDNELEAQKARNRATGQTGYRMPNASQGLSDFIELNKLDLNDDRARMLLKEQMKIMKDKAPIVHMTFAVEADPASLQSLVAYMRRELHPQALLSVGLQPSLVGGVYMRTPNHVHDFSVRAKLAQSRGVIAGDIEQLVHAIKVVEAPS
jgi:G3E family GTPase